MKNTKKYAYILFLAIMTMMLISCKKQVKHKWIEVGADPTPEKVTPGVHPERGSMSDAVPIVTAAVLVPTGRDSDGKLRYIKYLYDMEELTHEGVDMAMKELGLISENSVFCDLLIEDVGNGEDSISAGPGAESGETLNKKGTVRYAILDSNLINGKEGDELRDNLITLKDIEECVTGTYAENFQLATCDIEMISMEEYKRINGIKE